MRPGLVINEVYGGGGNAGTTWKSDFVELRNTGSTSVSLDGKSLQYRSGGGVNAPGLSNVHVLPDVSVPAGGTFLVKEADGTGGTKALPTPDATGALAMSGTGGQIFLANSTTPLDPNVPTGTAGSTFNADVIDFVGWGSSSTTSFEGVRAPATTNTTSITRANGADTDNNSADFTAGAPTPTNAAGETEPPTATALTATFPGNKTAIKDSPITSFTIGATGGTSPYHWTASGLPADLTISDGGVVSGTPTVAGPFSVTATVTDSASTPATASTTFTITVADPAEVETIAEIQARAPGRRMRRPPTRPRPPRPTARPSPPRV